MNSHAMAKFISLYQVFIVLGTKASSLGLGQESAQGYDPEASITGLYTGPYFDPLAPRNFTAHLGDQAILPCTVRQLGDKSVSWVRMRDADILTVDRYTFVGDERFESHYSAPQETWNLVIKYVQERDAGQYECQVSTEPKMSQFFSLRVVIPKVEILPPGDRYVKAGSEVRVDCQISEVVQLPDYIFWYHEEKRVMDHLDDNLVVAVKSTGAESITSTLSILKVPPEGSGNYTCMPSNLHTASVILHVLNEKHPAAMQGERSGASPRPETQSYILSIIFLLLLLYNAIYYDFNGYGKNTANGKVKKTRLSASKQFQILTALDNEEDFAFQNPYSTWWNVSGVNRKPEEPGVMFLSPAPHHSRVGIGFKPPVSNVSSPLANEGTNHDQIISSKLILQDDKLKLIDPKLYDDREEEEEGITTKVVGIRRDLAGKMDEESELVVRADVGLYIGSSSDR